MHEREHFSAPKLSVLIDFDNLVPGALDTYEYVSTTLDRILRHSIERFPTATAVDIRLYGGWLDDGVPTNRASQLEAAVGRLNLFPIPHPRLPGLLRGNISLATRLAAVRELEWGHTSRHRQGLPRVQLSQQPHPVGCANPSATCPVKTLQRFAKKPHRACNVTDCDVTNHSAFRVREQKMVDVMLCCDAMTFAERGSQVLIGSGDMDLLPAIALLATRFPSQVALLRSARASVTLYDDTLDNLGVSIDEWVMV